MIAVKLGAIIFGILAILNGVLNFNPKYVKWLLRFKNTVGGSKTQVTLSTLNFYKTGAYISIIIGIVIILLAFSLL